MSSIPLARQSHTQGGGPVPSVASARAVPVAQRLRAPPIALDATRLVRRMLRPAPTGIDRVDLAYLRAFLGRENDPCPERLGAARCFVHLPVLGFVELKLAGLRAFVGAMEAMWRSGRGRWRVLFRCAALLAGARLVPAKTAGSPGILIIASHLNLEHPCALERLLARTGLRLCVFLHDMIPVEFPQFGRADGAARHMARLASARRLAQAIIVNSQATARAIAPFLDPARPIPVVPALLGIERPIAKNPVQRLLARPYFLCVGTIEPRKNHRLLLDIWRDMATERPDDLPNLVLVGRRGWLNGDVFADLDKTPAGVHEINDASDADLHAWFRHAVAVLAPTVAEGYGLPLGEALAHGIPVIASDLPAHREIGKNAPVYLRPDDAGAWRAAIEEYALPHSAARAQQMHRLAGWRAPTWEEHFAIVEDFLAELA